MTSLPLFSLSQSFLVPPSHFTFSLFACQPKLLFIDEIVYIPINWLSRKSSSSSFHAKSINPFLLGRGLRHQVVPIAILDRALHQVISVRIKGESNRFRRNSSSLNTSSSHNQQLYFLNTKQLHLSSELEGNPSRRPLKMS